jgi:glyoxylate/hydroxypyruvate reductase A
MSKGAILLVTGPWAPEPWAAAIRSGHPDRPLFVWPDLPDAAAIRYALVWKPKEGLLATLPRLKVIFSLGAGVDHFIFQQGLPDAPIVRVVHDDLTQRMTEWVVLQVLMHHRRQRAYDRFQAERRWHHLLQPAAAEVRVGVMGLGILGRDSASVLARLGFRVAGWSRRPAQIAGIETFAGAGELDRFLARTDILVCLLPLTAETRRILSADLFGKLARDGALGGPIIINAGRGGLQVEADIIAAMTGGVLKGASLDVFETEPLDSGSPLWGLDNVVITPHAAADSSPAAVVPEILDQIEAYEAGRPLRNVVDRDALY